MKELQDNQENIDYQFINLSIYQFINLSIYQLLDLFF